MNRRTFLTNTGAVAVLSASGKAQGEEPELGRAIIDALMDECSFEAGSTRLVKRLTSAGASG